MISNVIELSVVSLSFYGGL